MQLWHYLDTAINKDTKRKGLVIEFWTNPKQEGDNRWFKLLMHVQGKRFEAEWRMMKHFNKGEFTVEEFFAQR